MLFLKYTLLQKADILKGTAIYVSYYIEDMQT